MLSSCRCWVFSLYSFWPSQFHLVQFLTFTVSILYGFWPSQFSTCLAYRSNKNKSKFQKSNKNMSKIPNLAGKIFNFGFFWSVHHSSHLLAGCHRSTASSSSNFTHILQYINAGLDATGVEQRHRGSLLDCWGRRTETVVAEEKAVLMMKVQQAADAKQCSNLKHLKQLASA